MSDEVKKMAAKFWKAVVFSDTREVEDKDVFNGAWLSVYGSGGRGRSVALQLFSLVKGY